MEENTTVASEQIEKDFSNKEAIIGMLIVCAVCVIYTLKTSGGMEGASGQAVVLKLANGIGFSIPAMFIGGLAYFLGKSSSYPRKIMIGAASVVAIASMIGSSKLEFSGNYDDCMLETMKGQPKDMMQYARTSCELKYPYEKQLYKYDPNDKIGDYFNTFKKDLDYSWWSDATSLNIQIKKNPSDYKVTKFTATFSRSKCDDTQNASEFDLEKTFVLKNGISGKILLNQGQDQYQCMRTVEIRGMRYKR